ncbi:hypothetical protein [Lederbergia citrisecunda]|uniref:hypothetical protein n=1 Tax=Lederbergia citrisecunda TaxID=2833583 RepID=UPI001F4045FC|nr:hypothetical protein [Lederbergia citrisecunda]
MKHTFQKAAAWIKRNARPLEVARWEYIFKNGSRDNVVRYLAAYQNEDGGFGHGIEPLAAILFSNGYLGSWTNFIGNRSK